MRRRRINEKAFIYFFLRKKIIYEKKMLPEPTLLKHLVALMHSIVFKCISFFETMQYNTNVKSIIVSLVE